MNLFRKVKRKNYYYPTSYLKKYFTNKTWILYTFSVKGSLRNFWKKYVVKNIRKCGKLRIIKCMENQEECHEDKLPLRKIIK